MQIVKITHYRCSDYDCTTWILAPDEWTEDDIQDKLNLAQDEYLKVMGEAVKLRAESRPPHVYSFGQWVASKLETDPDKTVGELRKEYEEHNERYKAYLAKEKATKRFFLEFLEEQGFISLYNESIPITKVEADWGHRHGWSLDYKFEPKELDQMLSPSKVIEVALSHLTNEMIEDFG